MTRIFDETWFFVPDLLGDKGQLDEEESGHLLRVLRLGLGQRIVVTNGCGLVRCARILSTGKCVTLELEDVLRHEVGPPRLSLLLSLLKGRDIEEPLEAVCQLELSRVQLVITDHCQSYKGKDWAKDWPAYSQRLRTKALMAMKQAKKAWLTEVLPPITLDTWRQSHSNAKVIIAHPGSDFLPPRDGTEALHLLIGPEGGFSQRELEGMVSGPEGYRLGLGTTRIRAVHAPMLALGKMMGMGYA